MAYLSLKLLGAFEASVAGEPIKQFYSDKVRAMLAYLVVEAAQPHRRTQLAGLFWPQQTETNARRSLRQALFQLQKVLGNNTAVPPLLLVTRSTVQFNLAADFELDSAAFSNLLTTEEANSNSKRTADLEQALSYYRGPFLAQFFLADSSPFEEWAYLKRETFHQQAVTAVRLLTTHSIQQNNLESAQIYGRRWLELEPWQEEAYRQLMRIHTLAGDQQAALSLYETCCRVLQAELGVEPTSETTALYQEIRLVGTRRVSLPVQHTPFIGRSQELAVIQRQLANDNCHLLTVVGPGGIGKTRLAIEAAAQAHGFLHGTYFVTLASVDTTDSVVPIIAEALGFTFSGQSHLKTQLLDYLHEKEMLLVLDNFEHILDGCSRTLISDILANSPKITLLITSRVRLQLRAEWLLALDGLSFPGSRDNNAANSEAVRLFIENAQRVQPGFTLTAVNQAHVIRICQLVAGMPLGIELAAAWLPGLTCDEIAAELERGLDILATDMTDVVERHRSLRAVFDYSTQMLSARERQIFYKLSVFRSGFDRQAVLAVVDATPAVLVRLINSSLLRRNRDGRYEIHELLRQYGYEKLRDETAVLKQTFNAHCHYFIQYLTSQLADLSNHNQQQALQNVRTVIDDVRQSWQWACDHCQTELIEQAILSLYQFYITRSWYAEGVRAFGLAFERLQEHPATQVQLHLLAHLRNRQAAFLHYLGQPESAQALLSESLPVLQNAADHEGEAFALHFLGRVLYDTSHYQEAEDHFQRSLTLYRQTSNQLGIARNLSRLADLFSEVWGQYEASLALSEECLSIYEALGDQHHAAYTRSNWAATLYTMGHYREAESLFTESLAMFREMKDKRGIGIVLVNLGATAELTAEYEKARAFYEESYALRQEIGYKKGMAMSLRNLANMAIQLGDYSEAQQFAQRAFDLYAEVDNQRGMATIYATLGDLAIKLGDNDAARNYLQKSLHLAAQIGAMPTVIGTVVSIATLLATMHKTCEAVQLVGFVRDHPATYDYYLDAVKDLLNKLTTPKNAEDIKGWLGEGSAIELKAIEAFFEQE